MFDVCLDITSVQTLHCCAGYTASANLSDISGANGMVPQRELQEGWRDPASAHRRINAAFTQLRQNAKADDLEPFLRELYDSIELDFDICSVTLSLPIVAVCCSMAWLVLNDALPLLLSCCCCYLSCLSGLICAVKSR